MEYFRCILISDSDFESLGVNQLQTITFIQPKSTSPYCNLGYKN